MSEPFIAEIRIFALNYAPRGWAFCNGQLLPISQNTALFSLLGTTYGGDGKRTFGLPNLQGSAPMHPGQGVGLSAHNLGETGGSETVALESSQLPSHTHALRAASDPATVNAPESYTTLMQSVGGSAYQSAATGPVPLAANAIAPMGGSLPHNNLMPYLVLNFCIALQGIFPARS